MGKFIDASYILVLSSFTVAIIYLNRQASLFFYQCAYINQGKYKDK